MSALEEDQKKSRGEDEHKHDHDDLLDAPETASLFSQDGERGWGTQPNSLLEKHPFLSGYLFLAVIVGVLLATHLLTFAIAFLFLYLISDFLTNDARRVFGFLPKALLFSVLYLAIVGLLIVFFYKVIPNLVRQLPGLAQQVQTQAIAQFEQANAKWELTRYVDADEVRSGIIGVSTKALGFFAGKFSSLYTGFVYFIFALVINLLLYHNSEKIDAVMARRPNSLADSSTTSSRSASRSFISISNA
jgi:predicted PurR-regulated permease PerM